jgi:acetylornithine aminotransferase/acetylornithine/N-succinyldiaminopimelate aminotransferase
LAVLDVIEDEDLLARVQKLTPAWHEKLGALIDEFPDKVNGLKGLGYMVGVVMAEDAIGWVAKLRSAGMLAPPAGGNVVRLLPPLNATEDELKESVEIFRRVLQG